MTDSRISILVPHFERFDFLQETLESAVKWARPGDQLIVVDDGSTITTFEKIEKQLSHVPSNLSPKLIRHPKNRGGAAARNSAVHGSVHNWLFCLDSDNLLTPGLLTSLVSAATDDSLDAAVPEYTVFFKTDPKVITHAWRYPNRSVALEDHFSRLGIVPSASGNYLFSRESWARAGGYPEGYVLDTWGFGLRQIGAGCVMQPVENTSYAHRYGHASYWVTGDREEMKKEVDLLIDEQPLVAQLAREGALKRHRRLRRVHLKPIFESDIYPHLKRESLDEGEHVPKKRIPLPILQQMKVVS